MEGVELTHVIRIYSVQDHLLIGIWVISLHIILAPRTFY